jgi:hypothetical protein
MGVLRGLVGESGQGGGEFVVQSGTEEEEFGIGRERGGGR